MHYLIDIGNSRLKYTLDCHELELNYLGHKDISILFNTLKRERVNKLTVIAGRSEIAIASWNRLKTFADNNGILFNQVKVNTDMLKINYQDISEFGTDRFLNLLACKSELNKNFCVVSCGTAITLDFYTNQHIGGMILPGVGISKQILTEKTGLRDIKKPTCILGNSTSSSIGVGIYFGYKNLIFSTIKKIEGNLKIVFKVVFTGGDAKELSKNNVIILELLFKGMQKYNKNITNI